MYPPPHMEEHGEVKVNIVEVRITLASSSCSRCIMENTGN
jgi:hypothetical protein